MTASLPPIPCSYRDDVRAAHGAETAVCRLLQRLTGSASAEACRIHRDACVACTETFAPSETELNAVLASLLYTAAVDISARGGTPGCSLAQAAWLRDWAEGSLDVEGDDRHLVTVAGPTAVVPPGRTIACDVVLSCGEASPETDRAIQSILAQEGISVFLHLVNDGPAGQAVLEHYRHHPRVLPHPQTAPRGLWPALQDLLPQLRSDFVAIQEAHTVSRSRRLADAVGLLLNHGGELLATALETPAGLIEPTKPAGNFRRFVPPETLVFRRASLIDMGGIAERPLGADAELVYRLAAEGRKVLLCPQAMVATRRPWQPGPVGPAPRYTPREGSLRRHAKGFPEAAVACDVVVPFHGHLDYLRATMTSLLDQEGVDLVIHLVDDASTTETEAELRHWKTDRRVRAYRNTRNLGQFTSFNNVFPYRETDYLAVQDADDINLPGRFHRAGNLLRLAGADIFAGRSRVFDDAELHRAGGDVRWLRRSQPCRASHYPTLTSGYFLENPTVVLRAAAFEQLGGFADFGDLDRNRCSLDTEFYLRASYNGRSFGLTRDVVLGYRQHPASAMQHPRTRLGSPARRWAEQEYRRRTLLFQQAAFDPRAFGALSCTLHAGQTRRV